MRTTIIIRITITPYTLFRWSSNTSRYGMDPGSLLKAIMGRVSCYESLEPYSVVQISPFVGVGGEQNEQLSMVGRLKRVRKHERLRRPSKQQFQ